jgi:hypothetical protein
LNSKDLAEQLNVCGTKRRTALWVPHDPGYWFKGMANRFDNAIVGNRPDAERSRRLECSEIMIAVDLDRLTIDSDELPWGDMSLDAAQRCPGTLLYHLHAATDTEHR